MPNVCEADIQSGLATTGARMSNFEDGIEALSFWKGIAKESEHLWRPGLKRGV